MSTSNTRTSDVEEVVFKIVTYILGTENWEADTSFLEEALTSFREKVVAEERENLLDKLNTFVHARADKYRDESTWKQPYASNRISTIAFDFKTYLKALTPPKEINK